MASGTLQLSAVDLRALTKWADPVIEDYLNTVRVVGEVVQSINIVVEQVAQMEASSSGAQIAKLRKVESDLSQVAAMMDGVRQQLGSQVVAIANQSNDMSQQLAEVGSSVDLMRAESAKTAAVMQDLVQFSANNATMIGQLASTIQVALSRIENLEQVTG